MSFWIVVARAFHGSPPINPMSQLLLRMHTECFCTGSVVAAAEDRADRLMIIVSGRVRVYLAGRANRGSGLLLTLGPGYGTAEKIACSRIGRLANLSPLTLSSGVVGFIHVMFSSLTLVTKFLA